MGGSTHVRGTDRPANRLAGETSPYLLQHAHNPVDWWPWGEGAFAEARRRDVPILLSVGYSTCYWCHVMERECFEDGAVAAIMNERFVCVKLDREERPDVDDVYMTALQAVSGRGGWPMNCFLEPATLRPFFCGTYFPPTERMGLPAWPDICRRVGEAWATKRADVLGQAQAVGDAVTQWLGSRRAAARVGQGHVSQAAGVLLRMFDRVHGGFGAAPKFPQPAFLEFLLEVRRGAGDEATRSAIDSACRTTLDRMACGGMHDQVGGGFHRYSVDETWTVPHFEKMLYDNAQLAGVYALAAAVYQDGFYRGVVASTLDFALREMRGDEGGFFSAQDAEVEGREGANFLWTPEQVHGVLAAAEADFAVRVYGLDRPANFRDPHHPGEPATHVLRLDDRPERLAERFGMSPEAFERRLASAAAALRGARARRAQPGTDDKVLAGWNGLMIGALARGSVVLGQEAYRHAAERAAGFVLERMSVPDPGTPSGRGLLRAWRAGRAHTPAVLEDYALLAQGLLELAWCLGGESAEARAWAEQGERLALDAEALFGDGEGGYYESRGDRGDLFVRARSVHDGAVPSGSSVMIHVWLDLARLTGKDEHLARAGAAVRAMSGAIRENPVGCVVATRGLFRAMSMDAALRAAGAEEPGDPGEATPAERPVPVEVYADTDRVVLREGEPGSLRLVLAIAPGYHINASEPGEPGLVPLRVHVVGGSGVAVYADYPEGERASAEHGVLVHRDRVELRVAVERAGAWSGRPLLAVTFQACTDRACLEARTVELDVALDRG